jgi:leucyl aminopeptidase
MVKNMKINLFIFFLVVLLAFEVQAKTLEQKKAEIKKIYQTGAISKLEYESAIEYIEKPKEKDKKIEKSLLSKKNRNKSYDISNFLKKKDKEKEKITLKKIEALGQPIKFDNTYYPKGMIKSFKGCNNSFKCKGDKAGQKLFKIFNKSKSYTQQNPGQMIKAMAMYEVFYAKKLWYARETLERYKKNDYKKENKLLKDLKKLKLNISTKKFLDEKEIRSLIGINKGRKSMREALGMNLDSPTKETIKKFWLLGEFLDLGTGVKNKKLNKDLKERHKLLETYKNEIAALKKKLQDDIDRKEDEKSVE